MTLNLTMPAMEPQLAPRITVIGVGGAGGNAVNNMIQANLEGAEFLLMNTDAQALAQSICDRRLQLGRNITQGLGAGSRPDIGRAAAEEALDEIQGQLEGSNMVFVTAGLGGGTGTGAAPVIAQAAREAGILTVGVVTKPFHFEGVHRMRIAEAGLSDLQQYVDTLIIIPNQNLFRVANEKTTFADAFKMADDVLYCGVRGVTDLMVMPGLINLDFADIRAVMTEMGKAMMGTGEAEGEQRSVAAAEAAISNPLLDDVSMKGARGVLINITGGPDLTLFEVDEAANRIRDEVDPEANIIFGSTFDAQLEGRMRVSVVATGIDVDEAVSPRPITLSLVHDRAHASARHVQPAAPQGGETTAAATPEAPEAPAQPESLPQEAEPVAEAEVELEAEAAPVASWSEEISEPINAMQPAEQVEAVAASLAETPLEVEDDEPESIEEPEQEAAEETVEQAERLAAAGDSFIPPPPVQPEAPARRVVERSASPEPFAAAAVANGTRDPSDQSTGVLTAKKQRGLFARMTEAARRMQGEERPAPRAADPAPSGVAPGMARSETAYPKEPSLQRSPTPASAAAPAAPPARPVSETMATAAAPASQPRLSGLETPAPAAPASAEDDLLDIPAFLRRQAN